jgi:hypothetical protein
MKSLITKPLITKSLISSGLIVVSLALNGNAAMAAYQPAYKAPAQISHARPALRVTQRRQAPARPELGIGQFIGALFGGPFLPQYPRIARNAVRGSVSDESPGWYDSPSPAVVIDNSQSQAAIDAADQAIQQADQDIQGLDASIAAAEAENDAANAAALQTEINAGM